MITSLRRVARPLLLAGILSSCALGEAPSRDGRHLLALQLRPDWAKLLDQIREVIGVIGVSLGIWV
jgi:hypothetical protein